MAKLFSVLFKTKENKDSYQKKLNEIGDWLKNEYSELSIKIIDHDTKYFVIIGSQDGLSINVDYGILGFCERNDWTINDKVPDGNFFIYRTKDDFFQLISDTTLSRTIYYYADEDYFVFSSLQIPIIFFKNKFCFNKENTPWFLTSGIHKPFHSFDEKVKILPPQNILSLNLYSFEYSKSEYKINISTSNDGYKDFVSVIKKSFADTIPKDKKAILLSGGIDSRLLLNLIDDKSGLTAITWTKKLTEESSTDLSIAKEIASKYDLSHEIIHLKNNDFNIVFDQFLKFSEGRIDLISGYLDGFNAWSIIEKMKLSSLFRGDETFSLYNGVTFSLIRHRNGVLELDDFETSLNKYLLENKYDFSEIKEHEGETLASYAKRIRIGYRVPFILGALNEIKCCFVEIYNPLLNNSIVEYSKQLNPAIDYREKYFKKINKEFSSIKYASKVSVERVDDYLANHKKELLHRLENIDKEVFTKIGLDIDAITQLLDRMSMINKPKSKWSVLKSFFPKKIKKRLLKLKKHQLSDIRIGFRILILAETFIKIEKMQHDN